MKPLVAALAVVYAFTCTAVAGQERPPTTTKPRPDVTGAKPPTPDAAFIGNAAMDGLAEIEHGRLAAQQASSPEVKKFAQRMIDDHQKAGDELKALATRKDVTLAAELDDEHRAMRDNLARLQGAAFDKAYMAQMVKAHLQAVGVFQQEVKTGQDPDVKEWAAKTLPTIQEHVKLASTISAKVNKTAK